MFESGDNRREPVSTSGGKEMARGTSREDTLAVFCLNVRTEVEEVAYLREAQKKQGQEPPINAGLLFFSLKSLNLFQ